MGSVSQKLIGLRWLKRPSTLLGRMHSTAMELKRNEWESVVGLEVHAQIQANTKLFSGSGVNFGSPVNTLVSLFDASVPGTLPVLNRQCVEAAVTTALALSCRINKNSTFDRKHYFYADLPAGYQITQQRKAIAEYGELKFLVIVPGGTVKPYYKTCGIRQLQLEQDSGKSLHDTEFDKSLIDLNRAGIALMEIVFQPDLKNGEEAAALVKELILILQTLNACNCRMEEGSLRVDANISINKPGEPLGTRTEVKNLSSLRSLVNSVEYEISRQIGVLEDGGAVTNETRSYDSERKMTLPMRDKEVQQDYRFMPEPNLPTLRLSDDLDSTDNPNSNHVNIASIKARKTVLPEEVRQNLISSYGLRVEVAHTLLHIPNLVEYFKEVMKNLPEGYGVRAANVLLTEVMGELHERDLSFDNITVHPKPISEIVELLESGKINISTAKLLLKHLFNGDTRTATQIVEDEGWITVKDGSLIKDLCGKVIKNNEKLAENYRLKRKPKYLNKLVGLVKLESTDKIDMKKVSETLQMLLEEKQN